MPYSEQEELEFSQKYFPTSFIYDKSMLNKFDQKHIQAYSTWVSYAMDIVHEKWYNYRSVKGDLDKARRVYNQMMDANIEFIEEDTWNTLREGVVDSLQLAKQHNLHMMTFGKSGSCIAADGRANWGTDCLFPSDMNEIIAMMPKRVEILIEGGKIFGEFGKKVEGMINKVISPDFRYNRAKKEAIEDAKRQVEYQQQQEAISHLRNEAESLAQQQSDAWNKIQEDPNSGDAEQLRILYQQLEEKKKQTETEAQQAEIFLKMTGDKNLEQKRKELPRNFQELYDNDKEGSFITISSEITRTSQDSSDNKTNKFPTKKLTLGGIIALIIGGTVYLIKNLVSIF